MGFPGFALSGSAIGGESMRESKTHVLVVDDEPDIRELFSETLEKEGYICSTAASGKEALQVLYSQRVDVAVVDIIMPGMSGLTLFDRIKEYSHDVAVVFVTAMDDVDIAVRNLKHGAYDYLVKPVTLRRLREMVREVLDKRDEESRTKGLVLKIPATIPSLTQREREVLCELGRGRSNKEISHLLDITQQTTKNHVTSVFRKLDVNDRTQAVLTGLRYGWINLEEGPEVRNGAGLQIAY
jgi:DNA-binding NarL/FixJ family response regulator